MLPEVEGRFRFTKEASGSYLVYNKITDEYLGTAIRQHHSWTTKCWGGDFATRLEAASYLYWQSKFVAEEELPVKRFADKLPEWVCDLIGIATYLGLVIASPFSKRARKLLKSA